MWERGMYVTDLFKMHKDNILLPVVMYKRQGSSDQEYPMLEAEAFVVAFQTEFLKTLFETFASSIIIICIDSTHKTNCHAFKLTYYCYCS